MAIKKGKKDIESRLMEKFSMDLIFSEDSDGNEEIDMRVSGNISEIELFARRAAIGYDATIQNLSGKNEEWWITLRTYLYRTRFDCPQAINCERPGSHAPYCSTDQYTSCRNYQRLLKEEEKEIKDIIDEYGWMLLIKN